jgi:hypothetical protein
MKESQCGDLNAVCKVLLKEEVVSEPFNPCGTSRGSSDGRCTAVYRPAPLVPEPQAASASKAPTAPPSSAAAPAPSDSTSRCNTLLPSHPPQAPYDCRLLLQRAQLARDSFLSHVVDLAASAARSAAWATPSDREEMWAVLRAHEDPSLPAQLHAAALLHAQLGSGSFGAVYPVDEPLVGSDGVERNACIKVTLLTTARLNRLICGPELVFVSMAHQSLHAASHQQQTCCCLEPARSAEH